MPSPPMTRRASYGPTSPTIGERGARTRQQIVDVTLDLFAERGFHNTLVEDIATAAGISRATLYQYFESKEQIFIGLVEQSGAALMRLVRRLDGLGPTEVGFQNLRWWLGQFAELYDTYATVFIQWADVNSPRAPLRPRLARFVEGHSARLAARFTEAGVEGVDPARVAIALFSIAERYNYYRCTRATGLSDQELLDSLAVASQLVLFPATPTTALPVIDSAAPRPAPPPTRSEPAPSDGAPRSEGLSPQAQSTVARLLDAGGRTFAASGFHDTSVDQIVSAAGLARGTFYKYFDDKLDLLVTLSEDCAARSADLNCSLAVVMAAPDRGVRLRAWLADFVAVHGKHAGVFRVWTTHQPLHPVLKRNSRETTRATIDSYGAILAGMEQPVPVDPQAGALMMIALLERFPDQADGTRYAMTPDETAETLAAVLERGLLGG